MTFFGIEHCHQIFRTSFKTDRRTEQMYTAVTLEGKRYIHFYKVSFLVSHSSLSRKSKIANAGG